MICTWDVIPLPKPNGLPGDSNNNLSASEWYWGEPE